MALNETKCFRPTPPPRGWVLITFKSSNAEGELGALLVTNKPFNVAECDETIRDAFAQISARKPGVRAEHAILCVHLTDRRSRAVSVTPADASLPAPSEPSAPPTEQKIRRMLMGASQVMTAVTITENNRVEEIVHTEVRQLNEFLLHYIHSMGSIAHLTDSQMGSIVRV